MSPGKQLRLPIPPFKHQRDNSILALGLRSSTQSGKTQMEPEAVTEGQSTQTPSRGSTGKQTLHLLLPSTKALGDEDEEDKEEDEGSRCQHSPSSPQQRVKEGWRASSSPPASSVRAEAQRASSPQSLEGWSSCRDPEPRVQDQNPKFLSKNAQTQHGKDDAMTCNQQIPFPINFSPGACAFSVQFFF